MTELIIIAAVARNGVIGSKNAIPWRISEDSKRFKRLTMGYACIMGDSTYDSLPDPWRPLPGRENVVLSLDPDYDRPGITVFRRFDLAIDYVRDQGAQKAFITGGATIYRLALPVADTLELTHIDRDYPGDVLFPPVDYSQWERVGEERRESLDSISGETVRYSFSTYRRFQPANR
ncbi:MAG: dihydrofolate reductase [Polyangiaceae bacterium]|nr:dihydrofolate reductase [Polyangiaceae bacterium]